MGFEIYTKAMWSGWQLWSRTVSPPGERRVWGPQWKDGVKEEFSSLFLSGLEKMEPSQVHYYR